MTTTSSIIRSAMLATGLAVVVGAMTACSDDSTASAPLTSNQITTTSMNSSATADKVATSESREQEPSVESSAADESTAADEPSAATNAPDTTKNDGDRSGGQNSGGQNNEAPQSVAAPQNVKLTEKQQNYLRALKQQNVTFMGDTDNNVALTMGAYICSEKKKGTDPVTVKAYVTASVGPGTKTVAEASSKADKVIRAARAEYC